MTVKAWLQAATKRLLRAGIETARLDALVIMAEFLNKNSAQLLAEPTAPLSTEQQRRLDLALERRLEHEPLAYIHGNKEFYGLSFEVNQAVMVPRPETEMMIDLLKSLPAAAQKVLVDVGTGSGAIAVAVASELDQAKVIATDIDPDCLAIAQRNVEKHHVKVSLKQADIVEGLELPAQATILANLPYVPNDYQINQAATHEPSLALFGGSDGLDLYHKLFEQLEAGKHRGYVLTEALDFQHPAMVTIAQKHGYTLADSQDLIQIFKASYPTKQTAK